MWLTDLPLADRLAEAAIRAGGAAEANLIRAHALSWLGRGQEADAVLAGTRELTDVDGARRAFLRATNRLFVLADPTGAKRLIEDASHTTPRQARACIDAFLTVYWAAMGKPETARQSSKTFALEELPDLVAARTTAWAITVACGEAGRVTEAVAAAQAGYSVPMRSFVALPDAHIGALLLAGRIAEAWQVAEQFYNAMVLLILCPSARCKRRYCDLGSSRPGRRPPSHGLFAAGSDGRCVVRLERHRVVVSMPAPPDHCFGHARFDR